MLEHTYFTILDVILPLGVIACVLILFFTDWFDRTDGADKHD